MEYALRLRDKRFAATLLDVIAMQPVLHISQRYPASRMCAAAVLPLTRHPRIDSRVIVFDLEGDPEVLLRLSPDEIADRLYIRAADLPEGEQRIPLKEVHLNKSPALVAWQHLREADFQRLGIDHDAVLAKAARLRELGPELAEKVRQVYGNERAAAPAVNDADASLYDGFLAEGDKRLLAQVRASAPTELGALESRFRDPRLIELLFRYRARNWPQTLSFEEQERWNVYRRQRLLKTVVWAKSRSTSSMRRSRIYGLLTPTMLPSKPYSTSSPPGVRTSNARYDHLFFRRQFQVSARPGPPQRQDLVQRPPASIRGARAPAVFAAHHRPAAGVGRGQRTLSRRSQDPGRFAVSHLPRCAVFQRQIAVQELARCAPVS